MNGASQLNDTCSSNPNALAFLDPSPVGFHNAFYHVLYSDMRSRSTVDYYVSNQGAFFGDFVAAMTKLERIGVNMPATGGEIRRDCGVPN
ncbi:peroxidase 45-like [Miscanthus floridulus]|uniref:peroxidase 45-like n=1 Tax=Miscanthus floridulus TaxID=154761 RepID=UPI0034594A89